jgi:hypothetical protein
MVVLVTGKNSENEVQLLPFAGYFAAISILRFILITVSDSGHCHCFLTLISASVIMSADFASLF